MGSALVYVLVVGVVAGVIYVATALLAGRGEELEPMPPGATPTRLPARDLTGADLRELRFQQSFRGYRMSEVDWALDRLAVEVDALRARLAVHESLPPPSGEDSETLTGNAYPRPAVPEEDPTPTDPTAGARSGTASRASTSSTASTASTSEGTSHGHA